MKKKSLQSKLDNPGYKAFCSKEAKSITRSCPFKKKRCFTDATVCGLIGYYADCPLKIDELKATTKEQVIII
uniref:Copy number control protein n=1 Tax=Acidianus ambivalens TaxID=2283 RepID=O57702_ACIAM|nr:hypothetical protein [Acidianus ambivalens]CAA12525.1 copy number control protein [Acidianus ambivalens]